MSVSNRQDGVTAALVAYAAAFTYADVPHSAVDEIKTIVLDTFGALLLGSSPQYSASRLTGDLARRSGGVAESTVIGRDFKTSCESAALANGTMGYAADIEGASVARQHVPAVVVPAALAVGEREHADGRTFMTALAVGYEVCARASEACRTEHSYPHSFHPSATFGYFGAAAAAGHILKLDRRQLANALGVAGTNAAGLMTWVFDPTEDSRPFGLGMAARGGVTAALLAQMGFGGPPAILDPGKYSIYDAYAGEAHVERVTDGLGESPLWITRAGGYKRYPCCGDIHTGLDALLGIVEEHRIPPDDITAIVHRVKADRAPVIDNNPLKSHCAQYIMAVAAVNRTIGPNDILQDRRADPRIRSMSERVTLVGDAAMDPWPAGSPAVVEVTARGGRTFSARVDWAKGRRENPMTRAELEEKFLRLAAARISHDAAERLMDQVYHLETVSDINDVAALLQVRPA